MPPGESDLFGAGEGSRLALELGQLLRRVAMQLARGYDLGNSQPIGARFRFGHLQVRHRLQPIPFGEDVEAPNLRFRGDHERSLPSIL